MNVSDSWRSPKKSAGRPEVEHRGPGAHLGLRQEHPGRAPAAHGADFGQSRILNRVAPVFLRRQANIELLGAPALMFSDGEALAP